MLYQMELSSVLCSLLKKSPKGDLRQFRSLVYVLLPSASGKCSHCVMCTHVRELYVACGVMRYTETSQLIKIFSKCTRPPFRVVWFTRLSGIMTF